MSDKKNYTIAVCGGSASGKTTFVHLLRKELGMKDVTCLSQDDYYRDLSHLTMEERDQVNFDEPRSIDSELLIEQFLQLSEGQSIKRPCYDFSTHCRTKETCEVKPEKILIFEGTFSLAFKELRNLYDLVLYLDVPSDIRFIRKLQRDIGSRGRKLTHVVDQYLSMVRVMHNKFVEPCKEHADFVIPWTHQSDKIVKSLCNQFMKR
jgi:uridine kinase